MSREIELIKEAVDRLLECELLPENGWTLEDIEILEKISDSDFEVNYK